MGGKKKGIEKEKDWGLETKFERDGGGDERELERQREERERRKEKEGEEEPEQEEENVERGGLSDGSWRRWTSSGVLRSLVQLFLWIYPQCLSNLSIFF